MKRFNSQEQQRSYWRETQARSRKKRNRRAGKSSQGNRYFDVGLGMMFRTRSLLDCVEIDLETGCWNWTKYKGRTGYACQISWQGRFVKASRLFAHFFLVFDLSDSRNVLHRCDNRACVNPKHFFFGTQLDNIHDMIKKGRHAWQLHGKM